MAKSTKSKPKKGSGKKEQPSGERHDLTQGVPVANAPTPQPDIRVPQTDYTTARPELKKEV